MNTRLLEMLTRANAPTAPTGCEASNRRAARPTNNRTVEVVGLDSALTLRRHFDDCKVPYCTMFFLPDCRWCKEARVEWSRASHRLRGYAWIACNAEADKPRIKQVMGVKTFPHILVNTGHLETRLAADSRDVEAYLAAAGHSRHELVVVENSDGFASTTQTLTDGPTVLLVYANWCHFCTDLKPIFNQAVREASRGSRGVQWCALSHDSPIIQKYKIQSYPTILLVHGTKIRPFHGPRTLETIRQFGKTGLLVQQL